MAILTPDGHSIYQLAAGLLLVFKPRGYREEEHTHTHAQRLRVLRGQLRVETKGEWVVLDSGDTSLTVASQQPHATEALEDTWLAVERVPHP